MNRTFIKVLPLAAAVLLATSCSKEDNNNEIVNNGQEKVEKQFKTITVKGNAGKKQGISKIMFSFNTGEIFFEENDEISFTGNDGVTGKGKFTDNIGNFVAELSFPEGVEVTNVEISATIGTPLTDAVVCKSTGKEIGKYLYEISLANSTLEEVNGEYKFKDPFTMVPQIAIIRNMTEDNATFKIGEGTEQTLDANKTLVVMSGTTLTINGRTATVSAGNSYTIAPTPPAPTVEGSFALTVGGMVNYTISSSIEDLEYFTDGGTTWNTVSNATLEMPANATTLSFRTAKTSTSYASEATSAVTVPTVLDIQVGDITLYYLKKEGEWVTYVLSDIAGISEEGGSNGAVAIYTDANDNRYHIFEDGETRPKTVMDLIGEEPRFTLKQILTVELNGMPFTYYAGDTWETLAGRNTNDEITVENGQVKKGLFEIICDNHGEPVNPNAEIDSNIDYQLQPAAD